MPKSNLEHLPSNIREMREMVRIFAKPPTGEWFITEDGVDYPVSVVIGGPTWAVETPDFAVVFEANFVPYTVYVVNHKIDRITDHLGNPCDEYWLTIGGSYVQHFHKARMHEGKVDRVCIAHRWDRQLYGSEEGRQGAQQKYTLGW
uniref:Uncharacterized protein n=1 Tax=Pseudomonas phage RVTF4 TaxID=3236931 RepID=A0AB39CCU0_9VIRU